jgi:hypothetical protein
MALVSESHNSNSLFSAVNNQYNLNSESTGDLQDILKSLNIIDPDSLSKDELSIILKRIDDYNGFFTTQQLENIDYAKFNQHVFFDSAVNKVSYSFDRIHNIPYDKDELENIKFINKTDGYTNYILNKIFPTSLGFARFSGNEKIVIYDEQGKLLNDSKTRKIGILNPYNKRFSFDFWIKVNKTGDISNQLVFKKYESVSKNGFICYVTEGSTPADNCFLNFVIFVNGKYLNSKCLIKRDSFQNIAISISSINNAKNISFIIDGNIVNESDISSLGALKNSTFGEEFKDRNIPFVLGGPFVIANNNSISDELTVQMGVGVNVTFSNFLGDIDEFRFFHKIRSAKTVKKEMHKNIYAQKALKLYLRLNEPGGEYQNSCLVIDYSGNKLHGLVYKYNSGSDVYSIVADTTLIKINAGTPLNLERKADSPVLNSSYTESITRRSKLIETAKNYDNNNPNLIFNLMPRHYFLNAADFQNLPVFSSIDAYTLP